ncbi:hypothetical protein BHE74_00044415, partial [Ensete ventricosum]
SNLPFLLEKAKFYRELEAAVDVVERACRLCVDVWDHAVGVICIQEAGGKVCFCVLVLLCSIDEKLIVSYQVTDWIGTELDLAADEAGRRIIHPSGGVLVTNGRLHNQLLEMISSNFRVIRHA